MYSRLPKWMNKNQSVDRSTGPSVRFLHSSAQPTILPEKTPTNQTVNNVTLYNAHTHTLARIRACAQTRARTPTNIARSLAHVEGTRYTLQECIQILYLHQWSWWKLVTSFAFYGCQTGHFVYIPGDKAFISIRLTGRKYQLLAQTGLVGGDILWKTGRRHIIYNINDFETALKLGSVQETY